MGCMMFCSECGKPAQGKFCSNCGTPLTTNQAPPVEVVADWANPDWEGEVRYETILKFPGVHDLIERHAQQAVKRMTGEQFLALADKLVPMGFSMEALAGVVQPLSVKMGIKTGKHRRGHVPAPLSRVLVRALCSMARNNQKLSSVTQAEDGC